jgi:hypothetical protein
LTYANVIATIALFVALGGASYAATNLPKNSVGTKQIKNGAITAAKVRNGAITGAKIQASSLGTVPSATHAATADSAAVATRATTADSAARAASADSAAHATSADTATSANRADTASSATSADSAATATNAGNAAALGGVAAGQYVTATSVLPSGKTETGVFSAGGGPNGSFVPASVNFIPKAPTETAADHMVYSDQNTASAPHCPGVGRADPGYLCAYGGAENEASFYGFYNPTSTSAGGGTPDGTTIFFQLSGIQGYARGTWAYTAP